MNRGQFVSFATAEMRKKFPNSALGNISTTETELIIDTIFRCIVSAVMAGDEVRYKSFGIFKPQVVRGTDAKKELYTAIKLAFTSFSSLNKYLTENFLFKEEIDSIGTTNNGDKQRYFLSDISKMLKISLPTLHKYIKIHQDIIPVTIIGNNRLYDDSSVEVIRGIRERNAKRYGSNNPTDGGITLGE